MRCCKLILDCVCVSIQVNDQIVEVDGVSLVGVTQLFAATMLKNTIGTVRYASTDRLTLIHFLFADWLSLNTG